jgi:hypothetical protein
VGGPAPLPPGPVLGGAVVSAGPSYGPVPCYRCSFGKVYIPDADPFKPGRWTTCGTCGGTGRAMAFLYARPKARRRRA